MKTLEQLGARFKGLVGATRREASEIRAPEPPPPPDPDAAIRAAISGWLADERAKVLIGWLGQNMEKAIVTAHTNHLVSTEVSYQLGFEAGLRFVRDRLTKWAK
jgi:hypothetical protein